MDQTKLISNLLGVSIVAADKIAMLMAAASKYPCVDCSRRSDRNCLIFIFSIVLNPDRSKELRVRLKGDSLVEVAYTYISNIADSTYKEKRSHNGSDIPVVFAIELMERLDAS